MIAGTAGCTREKKLRNSLLKSGGEAESFSAAVVSLHRGPIVATAPGAPRKTRGTCDDVCVKEVAICGIAPHGSVTTVPRCRADAAQAKAAHLRGLLLPQEHALRARAERALRHLPPEPPRGPGPPAAVLLMRRRAGPRAAAAPRARGPPLDRRRSLASCCAGLPLGIRDRTLELVLRRIARASWEEWGVPSARRPDFRGGRREWRPAKIPASGGTPNSSRQPSRPPAMFAVPNATSSPTSPACAARWTR